MLSIIHMSIDYKWNPSKVMMYVKLIIIIT